MFEGPPTTRFQRWGLCDINRKQGLKVFEGVQDLPQKQMDRWAQGIDRCRGSLYLYHLSVNCGRSLALIGHMSTFRLSADCRAALRLWAEEAV